MVANALTSEQVNDAIKRYNLDISGGLGAQENLDATNLARFQGIADEQGRIRQTELIAAKGQEFRAILTPEDQFALDQFYSVEDDPRWPEAEDLKDRSLTKKGFPSWTLARIRAEESGDIELANLIAQRQAATEAAKVVWDKQEAWFNSQPDDVKALLINEDPRTFGRYADSGGDSTGTPVSSTGGAGVPTTGNEAGSGSSYTPYRSYGRSSYSRGGGSYRPYSGGGSRSDEPQLVNQVFALDPFLASGQDDGRGAIAQQVSDHIQRLVGAFAMFAPDPRMGQMFAGLWMMLLSRRLGPNPDLAAWTNLLAWLKRNQMAQDRPVTQAPPAQPAIPALEPAPAPAAPVAGSNALGAY